MRYEHGFLAFLVAIVGLGVVAAGVTLAAAWEVASDDMRVGPGSVKFPPQGVYATPGAAR